MNTQNASVGTAQQSSSIVYKANTKIGTTIVPQNGIAASSSIANIAKQLAAPELIRPMMVQAEGSKIITSFSEKENGVTTTATLQPEPAMSSTEQLQIQLLIIGCMPSVASVQGFKPLSYIRQNNLERHFKFSSR